MSERCGGACVYVQNHQTALEFIFESILPNLAFNAKDKKLWVEDPHEYVQRVWIRSMTINPKTAAMNLSSICADFERNSAVAHAQIGEHASAICHSWKQQNRTDDSSKDGALVALGSLSENLMENELYMNALEGLIVQHVLPEFQNPNYPFMRERSCWILMRYCDLDFDSEHHLQCCVQKMLKSLRDPSCPFR